MNDTILHINTKKFLSWYFYKVGLEKAALSLGSDAIEDLYSHGSYSINCQKLLTNTKDLHDAIPLYLIEGFSEESPKLTVKSLFPKFKIHLI